MLRQFYAGPFGPLYRVGGGDDRDARGRPPDATAESTTRCHEENSSIVRSHRSQASARLISPSRTAITISAFRLNTHRLVYRDGRSALVSTLPFGPTMWGIGFRQSALQMGNFFVVMNAPAAE